MISAIVLAAGLSERMGRPKPLLPFGKYTAIEHVAFRLFKTGVYEIVVITGHEGRTVADALDGLPVRVVHNIGYIQGGMLSSVKTGIRAVSLGEVQNRKDAEQNRPKIEAALICLADQPGLDRGVVKRLIEIFKGGERERILVPSYKKHAGHPILVPASFWPRILALPPEGSLRDVMRGDDGNPVKYVTVETDSILRDMNTPEDYEREVARLAAEEGAVEGGSRFQDR